MASTTVIFFTGESMKIKIDHINLSVNKLSESIRWYENIFKFKVVESGQSNSGQPWAIVANDDTMVVMNTSASVLVSASNLVHKFYHFGIRITDELNWLQIIQRHNLKINSDDIVEYPHSKSWYISDPNGHKIEVSYSGGDKLKFPDLSTI